MIILLIDYNFLERVIFWLSYKIPLSKSIETKQTSQNSY